MRCYNCKKLGHIAKNCWSKGGGAEGKGPKGKGKGKGKEVAASMDDKAGSDLDAVWMVLAGDEVAEEVGDRVTSWLHGVNEGVEGSGGGYDLWTEDEISNDDSFNAVDYSPSTTESNDSSIDSDTNEFFSKTTVSSVDVESLPDLEIVSDSSGSSICELDDNVVEGALDCGDEPKTTTFAAAVLADSVSQTMETKLFDSGASRHMSPYKQKSINYFPIQKRVLTAADGGTFDAIGKGDMHVFLPNGKSTTKILLRDVLYAPKMGLTLISIRKIDTAGFALLFHKGSLSIFSHRKKRKN